MAFQIGEQFSQPVGVILDLSQSAVAAAAKPAAEDAALMAVVELDPPPAAANFTLLRFWKLAGLLLNDAAAFTVIGRSPSILVILRLSLRTMLNLVLFVPTLPSKVLAFWSSRRLQSGASFVLFPLFGAHFLAVFRVVAAVVFSILFFGPSHLRSLARET